MNISPNKQNNKQVKSNIPLTKTEIHSETLPHPDILKGYQQIPPDFPECIIAMAEKEQANAHKIERKSSNIILIQSFIGVITGFIALLFLCYLIYYSITIGQTSVAIAIVTAMAGVIGLFIYQGKK